MAQIIQDSQSSVVESNHQVFKRLYWYICFDIYRQLFDS